MDSVNKNTGDPESFVKINIGDNHSSILDWRRRPDDLNEAISRAFNRIESDTRSDWGLYNGSKEYKLCGINEYALMKKIIKDAPESRDTFFALDIGAGNFQWGRALADYLGQQKDLRTDIQVNIISIRGERNEAQNTYQQGICKIHEFGSFKIEELASEFKRLNFHFENNVDLIVSAWCFRHLADPVGTFQQSYELLKPKTGCFLVDTFYFEVDGISTPEDMHTNELLTQLFIDSKSTFIKHINLETRPFLEFFLQKSDCGPYKLPMVYDSISRTTLDVGSRSITRFERHGKPLGQLNLMPNEYAVGDKQIYEWLKQNHLFHSRAKMWSPLLQENIALSKLEYAIHTQLDIEDLIPVDTGPLTKSMIAATERIIAALQRGDYSQSEDHSLMVKMTSDHLKANYKNSVIDFVKGESDLLPKIAAKIESTPLIQALKETEDWNASHANGDTALHLAIKIHNAPFINYLLDQGVRIDLANGQGLTPLALADKYDPTGIFSAALTEAAIRHR
jgi:hypothetical protein